MRHLLCLVIIPLIFCQCNKRVDKVKICRFDKELISLFENYSDSNAINFEDNYSDIFNLYYSAIIKGNNEISDTESKLKHTSQYINNSNFNELYNDVLTRFNDMSEEELSIGKGFKNYSKLVNDSFMPTIYTHISPFGYSIITTDSLISISLDNYMGRDYEKYKGVLYNYQISKKERSRIIPDVFKGWIYAKFPNHSKSLIEGMVYEGAIIYAIDYILKNYNAYDIIGYDKDKAKWCENNEAKIWDAIIKSNHLYSTENIIYIKYMNEAPYCSALSGDVPAEIGKWIGYKIVSKYINKNGVETITDILNGNIQIVEILKSYN